MSAKTNGDSPALPGPMDAGLTKREYIATQAAQGLLANRYSYNLKDAALAEYAVAFADALLAELAKGATQ